MQEFVFVYRLPEDYVPGNESNQEAWRSWFQLIGNDLIEVGKPVVSTAKLGTCDEGARLAGFSVVRAHDLDSAVARADGCPALDDDGGVEVGTLLDLPGLPRGSSLATHEIRHRVGIDEFTSLAAEIELFADRELQLEPVEIEVWLRPGELLVFDNLALAHGRRGTRQPGELNQRVFGTRPYRSGSSSGSATDS